MRTKLFLATITLSLAGAFGLLLNANFAQAQGEGVIEGGDIYRVRNVTDGGDFTDPASADKCETLQYKVRIHNPGPGFLSQVHVKVTLPSNKVTQNVSTVVVSSQNADPSSTSDTATVNLSSAQKISYTAGSSELLDANGNFVKGLPDVVNGASVNIGNVGVSINEKRFVQFKAKIDCPQKPPCEDNPNTPGNECKPCVDNPETPGDECNPQPPCEDNPETDVDECNPVTPPSQPPVTPSTLPDTGPGEVAAIFTIVTMAGSAAYYVVNRRLGIDL